MLVLSKQENTNEKTIDTIYFIKYNRNGKCF